MARLEAELPVGVDGVGVDNGDGVCGVVDADGVRTALVEGLVEGVYVRGVVRLPLARLVEGGVDVMALSGALLCGVGITGEG